MAKIRHIALTTRNPSQVAAFYKEAFDMKEVRRNATGAVFLTDGYINLAILNCKTEKDADLGPHGLNYGGIHHIGFQVDDLEQASNKLKQAKGKGISIREGLESMKVGPQNYEFKWFGPDDVVIDISQKGWQVSA